MTTVFVRCESLLIDSICLGSHGFAHPVKVDVRLVSFPLSGVRNDLALELRPAALRRVVHCVVLHSFVLAALVGILVSLQAYVFQFTEIVVKIIPRLLTSVAATFSPAQSARQFPLQYAATIASRQRRA